MGCRSAAGLISGIDLRSVDIMAVSSVDSAIVVRDLRKVFVNGDVEIPVLKGIDLEIPQGEFVSIVGPSGSGKSTLIGLLAGLDNPTSGQIIVGGTEISGLSESKLAGIRGKLIGYVFQSFNLVNGLTAVENVELPMILNGIPGEPRKRAKALLESVSLGDRLHHLPGQLSGGQQQRVSLARAMACDPPIIIADEPTGNLDTVMGRQIVDLLEGTCKKTGKTLIIVTHDLEIAHRADRIMSLVDGRISK